MSSQHGVIYFQEDDFYLTDTSTNGIVINGSSAPIGTGGSVALKEGDILTFGDYEISVEVSSEASLGGSVEVNASTCSPDSSSDKEINSPHFDPLKSTPPALSPSSATGSMPVAGPEDFLSNAQSDHSAGVSDSFQPPSAGIDSSISEPIMQAPSVSTLDNIPEDWDLTGSSEVGEKVTSKSTQSARLSKSELIPDESTAAPRQSSILNKASGTVAAITHSDIPQSINQNDDLYQRFLMGAGLDVANIEGLDKLQAMEQFGALFREVVQGLMELLRARSELKSEFRMSRTTIRAVENNPLKFSPNIDEALRTLFLDQRSAYLSPSSAVQEAIGDVRNHQIAMIVGMQAAFSALMHRIQPENFVEEDGANFVKAALMSINKKSRSWGNYDKFYNDTVLNSGNAFEILFGDEFSKAYEEQIQRL